MLIKAQSSTAAEALELVSMLQARFVEGLERFHLPVVMT